MNNFQNKNDFSIKLDLLLQKVERIEQQLNTENIFNNNSEESVNSSKSSIFLNMLKNFAHRFFIKYEILIQKIERIEQVLHTKNIIKEDNKKVDISEASRFLNMHKKSVRRLVQLNKLKATRSENKRLLFSMEDLEKYKYKK